MCARLSGHAGIMAKRSSVDIEIHTLPVIEGATQLSKIFGFGLEQGESAETSGGLLISVAKEKRRSLVKSLTQKGIPAYEIGETKYGTGRVYLKKDYETINIRE